MSTAEASLAEIHAEADAIFSIIDINGDGAISKEELTSHLCAAGYAEEAVANIFNKLDTNKDGELSPDEVLAHDYLLVRAGATTCAP